MALWLAALAQRRCLLGYDKMWKIAAILNLRNIILLAYYLDLPGVSDSVKDPKWYGVQNYTHIHGRYPIEPIQWQILIPMYPIHYPRLEQPPTSRCLLPDPRLLPAHVNRTFYFHCAIFSFSISLTYCFILAVGPISHLHQSSKAPRRELPPGRRVGAVAPRLAQQLGKLSEPEMIQW